jgi:hypothetical protein
MKALNHTVSAEAQNWCTDGLMEEGIGSVIINMGLKSADEYI